MPKRRLSRTQLAFISCNPLRPLRADEPMAAALRRALAPRTRKLKKLLRQAAEGRVESIHDARTTIRRLRDGLALMGRTVFDPDRLAPLEDHLHDVERTLAATRDDDVFLDDLKQWTRGAPLLLRRGISPLAKRLDKRRKAHARTLARELRRKRTRSTVKEASRFMRGRPRATVGQPKNPAHAVPSLVRHFIADQIWRSYEEVLAYDTHVEAADFDVIHKVRSACRRLRYRLELFEGALPRGTVDVVDALRALQDRLGTLHDHVVAVETLEKWLASGRLPQTVGIDDYLGRHRKARDRLRAEFEREWHCLTSGTFRYVIANVASLHANGWHRARLARCAPSGGVGARP